MLAIKNATLVMRDHYILNAVILLEDKIITDFGESRNLSIPKGCEVIDAQGLYVGPGLVDIHTHADGNIFFPDHPATVCRHHLIHGATTVLPAIYTGWNSEKQVDAINILRTAMSTNPACANIGGFYMEGPYLNPNFGCDRANNSWADGIRKEKYQPVIDAAGELARVWCVAPEREGILEFMLDCKAKNPGVFFAVAHSAASPQEIEALIPYGLRIGTHHTNATGDRPKYSGCRGVCVDEAVNYNDSIFAELICDSRGIHVDPYMLRLVRKIKGDDKIVLISDTYACDGPDLPCQDDMDDINMKWDGEIAGSKMTLDVACRNMMKHTGASMVDVFKFASYNPSRAVGFFDRGEIAVGKRADLIIADHWMNVKKVLLEGKVFL